MSVEVQDGIDIQGRKGTGVLIHQTSGGVLRLVDGPWGRRGHRAKSAHGTPDKCSVKDVIYLHFGIVWKLIRVFHLWRLQWFLII